MGFSQGEMRFPCGTYAIVMDVPGVYNLEPLSKADEVAVDMLEKGDVLVNVVDATNLERNLFLTLEIREKNRPMIVVLNMWDEAGHKGIQIDVPELEKMLGVPVVTTCAISGVGIKRFVKRLSEAREGNFSVLSRENKWEEIGKIVEKTQKLHHHHHTLLERMEDITTKASTGLPIAALIVYISFMLVRFLGKAS